MAIHTGPVVAGHLGGAAGGNYAVTGDTVNTAARLLTAASAGTVIVSDTDWYSAYTDVVARHVKEAAAR